MSLPAGFALARGFARDTHLDDVVGAIAVGASAWSQTPIRIFGREVMQPRLTSWMGSASYTYSGRRHEPVPMPVAVSNLWHAVRAATGAEFDSVLANLYRDGRDSVSWHADDEPELGPEPTIASLSLGASRRFAVKCRATGERADVVLEHGDLLVMSGRSQIDYLHSVPKIVRPIGARLNLTFRRVTP
jgi:alkylated DNA repair dioxygenase AlkB